VKFLWMSFFQIAEEIFTVQVVVYVAESVNLELVTVSQDIVLRLVSRVTGWLCARTVSIQK